MPQSGLGRSSDSGDIERITVLDPLGTTGIVLGSRPGVSITVHAKGDLAGVKKVTPQTPPILGLSVTNTWSAPSSRSCRPVQSTARITLCIAFICAGSTVASNEKVKRSRCHHIPPAKNKTVLHRPPSA